MEIDGYFECLGVGMWIIYDWNVLCTCQSQKMSQRTLWRTIILRGGNETIYCRRSNSSDAVITVCMRPFSTTHLSHIFLSLPRPYGLSRSLMWWHTHTDTTHSIPNYVSSSSWILNEIAQHSWYNISDDSSTIMSFLSDPTRIHYATLYDLITCSIAMADAWRQPYMCDSTTTQQQTKQRTHQVL